MTDRATDCPTFVSLREYVDVRFGEIDRATVIRFAATENALNVARDALESRLENMNDFRTQLNHQSQTFVTRTELLSVAGLILGITTAIVGIASALVMWSK